MSATYSCNNDGRNATASTAYIVTNLPAWACGKLGNGDGARTRDAGEATLPVIDAATGFGW